MDRQHALSCIAVTSVFLFIVVFVCMAATFDHLNGGFVEHQSPYTITVTTYTGSHEGVVAEPDAQLHWPSDPPSSHRKWFVYHAGLPKTGSSTLQEAIRLNCRELFLLRILCPHRCVSHHRLMRLPGANGPQPFCMADPTPHVSLHMQYFQAAITATPTGYVLLFSNECYLQIGQSGMIQLREMVLRAKFRWHFVWFWREPASWHFSMWRQMSKLMNSPMPSERAVQPGIWQHPMYLRIVHFPAILKFVSMSNVTMISFDGVVAARKSFFEVLVDDVIGRLQAGSVVSNGAPAVHRQRADVKFRAVTSVVNRQKTPLLTYDIRYLVAHILPPLSAAQAASGCHRPSLSDIREHLDVFLPVARQEGLEATLYQSAAVLRRNSEWFFRTFAAPNAPHRQHLLYWNVTALRAVRPPVYYVNITRLLSIPQLLPFWIHCPD